MSLYHAEINWPKKIPIKWEGIPVTLSYHALDRCNEKNIRIPNKLTGDAFEVELTNGRINKLALRCNYSDTHDLCVVISSTGLVITCWLNHKLDKHGTLDRSKYAA